MHWSDYYADKSQIAPRPPRPDAPVQMRAAVDFELAGRGPITTGERFACRPWIAQTLYREGKDFPRDSGDLLRMSLVKGPAPRSAAGRGN